MNNKPRCTCNRSAQGRAVCPTPERCAEWMQCLDDPQVHSDEIVRTARTLDEMFGRRHIGPSNWAQPGIPWLARSVLGALLVLVLLVVALAIVSPP